MSWFGEWFSLGEGAEGGGGGGPPPTPIPAPPTPVVGEAIDHVAAALDRLPLQFRGRGDGGL